MDENKKLQDRIRKEKYLNKMKNKNNNNDYIRNNNTNNNNNVNNSVLINDITPVPKEDSLKKEITEKETFESCAETFSDYNINNNNKNNKNEGESENCVDNNDVDLKENNTNSSTKINYVDTLKKANKYKYIINIINLIKKLILIILTIIHCKKYFELDDVSKFKYTILIIELSSLLINKLLNKKITNLIKNNKIMDNKDNNNKNESDFILNYFVDILYRLMKKSGPLNYIISFLFFVKDVFGDFWIIFLTNIIFFILTEED